MRLIKCNAINFCREQLILLGFYMVIFWFNNNIDWWKFYFDFSQIRVMEYFDSTNISGIML